MAFIFIYQHRAGWLGVVNKSFKFWYQNIFEMKNVCMASSLFFKKRYNY